MTTHDLYRDYRQSLQSLIELRARAGCRNPRLKDSQALRVDARRFARRLGSAPDADTAELVLLADHAGAQAFWFLVARHWESMELLLLPAAFELVPNPLPYEIVTHCFGWLLETEPIESAPPAFGYPAEEPTGTYFEARTGFDSLELSPWMGDRQAGAVWQFSDAY
jgi:hypothetical protein